MDLNTTARQIAEVAHSLGLRPGAVHFEIVPAHIIYEFGAYGLPGRFSHWTMGKAYDRMKTLHDHGLTKILELAINADPVYGFLLDTNSDLENKLVMAHVLGHADTSRNNAYYQQTNKDMLDIANLHANRLARYTTKHGDKKVEEFLDCVLSLVSNIDPNQYIKPRKPEEKKSKAKETDYDDLWGYATSVEITPSFPEHPERDILYFLMEHSPTLEDWQRDIIGIIRQEAYYFLPQMRTKILAEGWATYWHNTICHEMDLNDREYIDFARLHSAIIHPNPLSLNPYRLGYFLFKDIERRWNGKLEDYERKEYKEKGWDIMEGQGREKIFEVANLCDDQSFIRNYLSRKCIEDSKTYLYGEENKVLVITETDWEVIRNGLANSLANLGLPVIEIVDANYEKKGQLLLEHRYEGLELKSDWADKTLKNLTKLWGRGVYLRTRKNDREVTLYAGV